MLLEVDNQVSVFAFPVAFKQDAMELEGEIYASRHKKRDTVTLPNTRDTIGLVNIPGVDMTAGVKMTGGCNATLTLQVIGGLTGGSGGGSDPPGSSDEEKLSLG